MKSPSLTLTLFSSVLVILALVACSRGAATTATDVSRSASIEHGRYLVHRVAGCADCHSPRNQDGSFVEGKHLTGAPIGFTSTVPMPWAPFAPGLAGLPANYTEADLTAFLETGKRPHGLPPALPPMPAYRLEKNDAEAVTAYLASLPR